MTRHNKKVDQKQKSALSSQVSHSVRHLQIHCTEERFERQKASYTHSRQTSTACAPHPVKLGVTTGPKKQR